MRVIACVNAALGLHILAFFPPHNKSILPRPSYSSISLSLSPDRVIRLNTRKHARNPVHPSQEQLYTFRTINSNCLSRPKWVVPPTCPKPGSPVRIRSCTSWRLKCAYVRVSNLSGNSKYIFMHPKNAYDVLKRISTVGSPTTFAK